MATLGEALAEARRRSFPALVIVAALFLWSPRLVAVIVGAGAGLIGLLAVLGDTPDPSEGIYLPASVGPFLLGVGGHRGGARCLAPILAAMGDSRTTQVGAAGSASRSPPSGSP